MATYLSNAAEVRTVTFVAVTASLLAAFGIGAMVTALGFQNWTWFVSPPSALSLFSAVFAFYDRRAWRCSWLRRVQIAQTPDFSGVWVGLGTSSHIDETGANKTFDACLEIRQTWTTLHIRATFAESDSYSQTVSVTAPPDSDGQLTYTYGNVPGSFRAALAQHDGTATLVLRGNEVEGRYYTGRGRETWGTLQLRRSP